MAVSREKLYGEIWAEPMTVVAKRYGVSSNYLARVCANLKIPTPQRGYWQQLRARVRVKRPALAAPEPGDVLEWVRDGSEPQIEDWRFVQAARSLAAAAEELVASRGLQVSEGGPLEKWLEGIRKIVDEADPLSGLRHDVDKMAKEGGVWPRASFGAARRFALRRRRWMGR